jgi:mRNA-degrading endonuclease RelE of RelBE toxin-antitoxin system
LKKLKGRDDWRLRAGDWRIFLEFFEKTVHVTGISDRQDAYS